MDMKYIDKVDI